jgi:3-deoxy-D-manno-octulosonate 8-phosphate phosphatase (KDO 8-P phosphatase)
VKAEDRAALVKLLILDVDGVLTDGGLKYGADGGISKRFNVQDGLGIKLAQSVGLEIAVITGLSSPAVEKRVRELGIEDYFHGRLDKAEILHTLCTRKHLDTAETAFMGDDWIDAAVMSRVGLSMAPADAQPEILDLATWVSSKPGGQGAVREAIAFILSARGEYAKIWETWRRG